VEKGEIYEPVVSADDRRMIPAGWYPEAPDTCLGKHEIPNMLK